MNFKGGRWGHMSGPYQDFNFLLWLYITSLCIFFVDLLAYLKFFNSLIICILIYICDFIYFLFFQQYFQFYLISHIEMFLYSYSYYMVICIIHLKCMFMYKIIIILSLNVFC